MAIAISSDSMPSELDAPTREIRSAGRSDPEVTVSVEPGRSPVARIGAGQTLGRFAIREQLGRGGMGEVYRAHDPRLNRDVAVKVLQRRHDREDRERLRREAQAMAALNHPNILPIFDMGEEGPVAFIAMELVEGRTLSEWLHRELHPWPELLEVLQAAGRGLEAAHRAGVVHRDFKPANVMVGYDGRVRVMDFGLASATGHTTEVESDQLRPPLGGDPNLTASGVAMGTPPYMAPEQHFGHEVTPSWDQYAFCVTAWEVLYGERPFLAGTMELLVESKMRGPSPPLDSDVPAALHAVLRRGLSPKAAQRYDSMTSLLAALVPPASRAKRRTTARVLGAAAVVTVVVAAAIGTNAAPEPSRCPQRRAEFERAWNDEVKADAERSFAAVDPRAWPRIRRTIDEYAEAWNSAHHDACEQPQTLRSELREELEAHRQCLDERLTHLRGVTTMLREADEGIVRRAGSAVRSLPSVESCLDVEALHDQLLVPSDPTLRTRVVELREQLAHAKALEGLGRLEESLAFIEQLRASASEVEYEPLRAELDLAAGYVLDGIGRYDDATDALERAFFVAQRFDLHDIVARSSLRLAVQTAHRHGRIDEGWAWSHHAASAIERMHGGSRYQVPLLNTNASLYLKSGELDRAIEAYREVIRITEAEAHGTARFPDAVAHNDLGRIYIERGQNRRARDEFRDAHAILVEKLGEHHLHTLSMLNNVAIATERAGELQEARLVYDRTLEALRANDHGASMTAADTVDNRGTLHAKLGHWEEALADHEHALEIGTTLLGPGHIRLAQTHFNLGNALVGLERTTDARESFRRSLSIVETEYGPEHPDAIETLVALGQSFVRDGQHESGVPHLQRACDIARSVAVDDERAAQRSVQCDLEYARVWLAMWMRAPGQALKLTARAPR